MKQDFLVEIGTEELPPRSLKTLMSALTMGIEAELNSAGLEHLAIKGYATPRRLAVLISALDSQQVDSLSERLGPPVASAFDANNTPTPAALGFAKSCGVDVENLEQVDTDKGLRLGYTSRLPGQQTVQLMPEIIVQVLKGLPIEKRMHWGGFKEEFVRPVRWLVMLFGKDIVPASILGQTSGRLSRGHRFHSSGPITIASASVYADTLRKAFVITDYVERRASIASGVRALADNVGGQVQIDEKLLDEVTGLVEWPVPLLGRFDNDFLSVPPEALISSMKEHQKYFHLVDGERELLPYFITVSNLDSRDPDRIVAGNEKVIRPRLADASFFYKNDLKQDLASRVDGLKTVVFQHQLGTVYDKSKRITALCTYLAPLLGADTKIAERAARLCKADLLTDMVGEFPELQGIMGAYYATHHGENPLTALAIQEQYLPRFAGDKVATNPVGCTLAIADRLDTLAGIFAIGQKPTGSKDPFGLRRASLGILRTIIENEHGLDLAQTLNVALDAYQDLQVDHTALCEEVLTYILERMAAWYQDLGIPSEVFQAVTAKNLSQPFDIHQRVLAVNDFRQLPEASSLASANKRVSNILVKQAEGTGNGEISPELLHEPAEAKLAKALTRLKAEIRPLMAAQEYTQSLQRLALLEEPVNQFFDQVMVNTDNPALRNNRINILQNLRGLFLDVADISLLAGS